MEANIYAKQLTPDEIAANAHREMVGGMWDEIGRLQFDFLMGQGLAPTHCLADVGCGALRGGLHFIRYLDAGNYCGIDVNASLIEAGRRELQAAGLAAKAPRLAVTDTFDLAQFGVAFDCAIAVSLFTHLPVNSIQRCLAEVGRALRPGAALYATYFEAPAPAHLAALRHTPGDITTRYDADPYHYAFVELAAMARHAGLTAERIGDWNHPRAQRMAKFVRGA